MKRGNYVVMDICCGMGGLSLSAQEVGMRPVAGIDINENALKTYRRNFTKSLAIKADITNPKTIDVCKVLWGKIKKKNKKLVILSGPPCQGFSVAGPRNPNDPRNNVLVDVARMISQIKPHFALIENVSAVLTKRNSRRVNKLKRILKGAGYNVLALKMDALDFGVAQKRRRAFFMITKNKLSTKDVEDFLYTFHKDEKNVELAFECLPPARSRPDEYSDENDSGNYPNHFSMKHSESVIKKIASIKQGEGPLSYRKLDPSKPAKTLLSGHRAPPAHPHEPRSITVREAARLQGFPDTFKVYGSFGKQMEQVTSAVPPPLGIAALSAVLNFTS
jgi:DNA (cytosine-5)-methyltransferase 1